MTAFFLSLALAAAAPADDPAPIFAGFEGGTCVVIFLGHRYALPADEARVVAYLRSLRRRHRGARLILMGLDTPYRCIGSLLHHARREGVSLGLLAEPPARR
jgi:hypothetical protein